MNALILGGNGDIGDAIATKLRSNPNLIVRTTSRSELDLSSIDSFTQFMSQNDPCYDVLVHAAGLNDPKPFELSTSEDIDVALKVNVLTFLQLVKWQIPYWRKVGGGKVVVLSSLYGFLARKNRLPYSVSKHALIGVVKSLSIELGPINVLVNAVSPGFIDTKLTRKNNSFDVIQELAKRTPLGRLGTPKEISEIVAFLCGSTNSYLTGQDIVVDGGYSIGGFQL
jgi:3-oxoacyl-[acyl-carrier protein] reductase